MWQLHSWFWFNTFIDVPHSLQPGTRVLHEGRQIFYFFPLCFDDKVSAAAIATEIGKKSSQNHVLL